MNTLKLNILSTKVAGAVEFSGQLIKLDALHQKFAPHLKKRTFRKLVLPRIERYHKNIVIATEGEDVRLVCLK